MSAEEIALGANRGENSDLKGLLHPEFIPPELYFGTYLSYVYFYLSLHEDARSWLAETHGDRRTLEQSRRVMLSVRLELAGVLRLFLPLGISLFLSVVAHWPALHGAWVRWDRQ